MEITVMGTDAVFSAPYSVSDSAVCHGARSRDGDNQSLAGKQGLIPANHGKG